jgi:hypothetical protein
VLTKIKHMLENRSSQAFCDLTLEGTAHKLFWGSFGNG